MTLYLVLDILLLILLALFVPVGFWRGVTREILVTLGILLGFALGEFWALPWGEFFADWIGLGDAATTFLVAVILLVACTFLIGYGAGAVIMVPRPRLIGRLVGAVVALANGILLLGFALRTIRLYLLGGSASGLFEQALVARILSESMPWVLLVGAIVSVPVILLAAVLGTETVSEVVEPERPTSEFALQHTPTRRFPPRIATAHEPQTVAYKTEPAHSSEEPTRPLQRPTERPENGGQKVSDLASQETVVLIRPSGSPPRSPDNRCPYCHADISDAEVFCPRCGRVL